MLSKLFLLFCGVFYDKIRKENGRRGGTWIDRKTDVIYRKKDVEDVRSFPFLMKSSFI